MNILGRLSIGEDARADAEWWRGAVIYQIYPRSFADSDGDGIGDLAGIIANLDHVASLGVDGIWLSPFFQSPMKDFGYDVSDYRAVDPIFGSLDDFDALVARAHALGLKVVIDQVYSHTSDEHPWFTDSRSARDAAKSDWYVWADARLDGTPPNNWQSVFGGPAWTWDARRRQYYLHNFLPGQPQLNGHNPAVQQALLDVARFWLDRGVDGFRLDAINFAMHDPALADNPVAPVTGQPHTRPFDFQQHIHNQSHPDILNFLGRLRVLLDSYGMRFTVAEIGAGDAEREMKAFTAGNTLLNSAYGFTFLNALTLDPSLLREALRVWRGGEGEGWPSWAFSNHDAPRHVSRWHQGPARDAFARMTLLLLMCLRGNVFLYQGEELGLPQAHVPFDRLQDPDAIANWPETLGRDGARTPMPWVSGAPNSGFSTVEPWLPVDPVHDALAVDAQHADAGSTLAFARRAVALRAAYPALRAGSLAFVDAPEPIVALERAAGAERLLCVFNLGADGSAWQPVEPNWQLVAMSDSGMPSSGAPPAILPAMTGYVAAMPA